MQTNSFVVETLFFERFFKEETFKEAKRWRLKDDEQYENVQHSVAENIGYILNTINALPVDEFLNKKLIFLDFGIPDIFTLYQTNTISVSKLLDCIKHAVKSFEPRLHEVEVNLEIIDNKPVVQIKGRLLKKEQTYFELAYYSIS